jgi:hypothetical protein
VYVKSVSASEIDWKGEVAPASCADFPLRGAATARRPLNVRPSEETFSPLKLSTYIQRGLTLEVTSRGVRS